MITVRRDGERLAYGIPATGFPARHGEGAKAPQPNKVTYPKRPPRLAVTGDGGRLCLEKGDKMAQKKVLTLAGAKGRARTCYPLRTLYGGGWALLTAGDDGEKKLCRKAKRHISYLEWVRDTAPATIAAKQWASSRLSAIEYALARQLAGELRRAEKELQLATRTPRVDDGTPHLHKQVATSLTDVRTMTAEQRAAARAVDSHRAVREDGPVGRAHTCEGAEKRNAVIKARKELAYAEYKRDSATQPRYRKYWTDKAARLAAELNECEAALAAL